MGLIRSSEDAERAAFLWMREHGFPDARMTPSGADGGIDVHSKDAVAQVKAQVKPVGRPIVQQLAGAAAPRQKRALLFALGGFTNEAEEWAAIANVALFEFDLAGSIVPANRAARSVVHDSLTPTEYPWRTTRSPTGFVQLRNYGVAAFEDLVEFVSERSGTIVGGPDDWISSPFISRVDLHWTLTVQALAPEPVSVTVAARLGRGTGFADPLHRSRSLLHREFEWGLSEDDWTPTPEAAPDASFTWDVRTRSFTTQEQATRDLGRLLGSNRVPVDECQCRWRVESVESALHLVIEEMTNLVELAAEVVDQQRSELLLRIEERLHHIDRLLDIAASDSLQLGEVTVGKLAHLMAQAGELQPHTMQRKSSGLELAEIVDTFVDARKAICIRGLLDPPNSALTWYVEYPASAKSTEIRLTIQGGSIDKLGDRFVVEPDGSAFSLLGSGAHAEEALCAALSALGFTLDMFEKTVTKTRDTTFSGPQDLPDQINTNLADGSGNDAIGRDSS